MLADFQKVLVLAPHTDDGEIGCVGYFEGSQLKKVPSDEAVSH